LSKHDHKWEATDEASAAELPAPLMGMAEAGRDDALIRFLAAAADWQAAGQRLSGAFAEDEARQLRLQQEK
jgi:hypothetical protein